MQTHGLVELQLHVNILPSFFLSLLLLLQFTSNAQLLARLVQLSQPLLPSATSTDLALLLWSLGTMTCRLQRCSSATGCYGKGLDSSCIIRAAWLQRVLYHSGRILVGASANDLICMLLGVTRMRLHPGEKSRLLEQQRAASLSCVW